MVRESECFLLDCTFRDGGYYTDWDFPAGLIQDYLRAMAAAGVDIVELGMRSLKNEGFKGACAFTPDDFLRSLEIPDTLALGVMVNAAELLQDGQVSTAALEALFPEPAQTSPVDLVRIACHVHELVPALPAATWLNERGYRVGFNLMQVADRSEQEIAGLAAEATQWPVEVLYFADSLGSLDPERTAAIVRTLRENWFGAIGMHAHDNMGLAQTNALRAVDEGATWVDATVTGMGRGPGNPRTEHMAIEIAERRGEAPNLAPLLELVRRNFEPMRQQYGWGTNPYYYLAGKHGIHPTYVQHMLSDARFDPEDLLAVIDYLKGVEAHQFSPCTLEFARHFYPSEPSGSWDPAEELYAREVLILGAGPSAHAHQDGLSAFIRSRKPVVIALNTQQPVDESLIDYRAACHPIRLLADVEDHCRLRSPLITPKTMLPRPVQLALGPKETRDYGLQIVADQFAPQSKYAVIPSSLVIAYVLAVAVRAGPSNIYLAGFDGYGPGDPRTLEVDHILAVYQGLSGSPPLISLTRTQYSLAARSLFCPFHE
ncbi:aldolase catalytic domain-containing protein [Thioalkalivibrio sp. ALgr3]|uniref:aldolase catalytic domain-containing protein n=1 Tax=Thioalkalivibrio sp. ALgr3 TaxID=1239292 RepID=UPI0003654CF3|nr:aldolase catalytic domain-containing protein [Thioalkalivibrio sp. ALgr3]